MADLAQAGQALGGLFILAMLVEALIEHLGGPIPTRYKRYASALLGILLCVAYNADLLALLDLRAAWPFVGQIVTGIVISRGANYLADWLAGIATRRVVRPSSAPVAEQP